MTADQRVVVIGAGGHAKVVIDLLRGSGFHVVGCADPKPSSAEVNGVPVLGGEKEVLPLLRSQGVRFAFVALGDNRLRSRVADEVAGYGFEFVNAIGRSAVISQSARLGRGCALMEGAVVNADTIVGDFAIINTNASVDHDCVIGAASHVAPGAVLAGGVNVGQRTFMGAGCRAIPGVSICADSVVGAGAVVVDDIEQAGTWVGVPARLIKART